MRGISSAETYISTVFSIQGRPGSLGIFKGATANCFQFLKALNKQIVNHCMFYETDWNKYRKINESQDLPNFYHETFPNCDFGVALPQV